VGVLLWAKIARRVDVEKAGAATPSIRYCTSAIAITAISPDRTLFIVFMRFASIHAYLQAARKEDCQYSFCVAFV
jgi:hypothetical protein